MASIVPPASTVPLASTAPLVTEPQSTPTDEIFATNEDIAVRTSPFHFDTLPDRSATGVVGGIVEDESLNSISLLVVSILLLMVMTCLFGYLMYKEDSKRRTLQETSGSAKKGKNPSVSHKDNSESRRFG
jgi:hypothetical protein